MSIFITGDTHGSTDISKLGLSRFWEAERLTKNDYVIILGDFGLIWDNYPNVDEKRWLKLRMFFRHQLHH